jgi:hypothetical protein
MDTVSSGKVLDDLRAADGITRRLERRYWLSSADFYRLLVQGLLDDGEHTKELALGPPTTRSSWIGRRACNGFRRSACANSPIALPWASRPLTDGGQAPPIGLPPDAASIPYWVNGTSELVPLGAWTNGLP